MLGMLDKVLSVADKVIPDTSEGRKLKAELETGWRDALVSSDQGQVQQNMADAASGDKYRSRARPTALWICVWGMAYDLLVFPMLTWLCLNMDWVPPPELDQATLYALTSGLLGLAAARSHDIWRGKR